MRFLISILALIFYSVQVVNAQEISGLVLDANTKQPIPFATVQYATYKGVITNDEGRFGFQASLSENDTITISSLGYLPLSKIYKDFKKDGNLLLKVANIELKDVFITNRNLTGAEIVKRVKDRINDNYNFGLTQKKFFFRESNVNNVKQFDLLVEKSTFPDLDQNLMNQISDNIPKISDSYKEILGDLYGNYVSQKIQIIKAANLHNPQSTTSLTELTDRVEKIFKDNVKSSSFLKIKSGILGVKVDAEELEKEFEEEKIAEKPGKKNQEDKDKEVAQNAKNLQNVANSRIQSLLKGMFWKEEITLDLFDKSKKYKFKVEGFTHLDNSVVYVISFEPKRGADFKGKMYVNTKDFGVHRIDFANVKPLKKFRLLGISTSDDVYRGKMIFSKNPDGKYEPKYLEREVGESFGIDRPLTIIEKHRKVRGQNKQNELDLDIKINVGQLRKYQLVVYENASLEESVFQNTTVSTLFQYETFKIYNPDYWKGNTIIEPNAAIKAFTALEEDLY